MHDVSSLEQEQGLVEEDGPCETLMETWVLAEEVIDDDQEAVKCVIEYPQHEELVWEVPVDQMQVMVQVVGKNAQQVCSAAQWILCVAS